VCVCLGKDEGARAEGEGEEEAGGGQAPPRVGGEREEEEGDRDQGYSGDLLSSLLYSVTYCTVFGLVFKSPNKSRGWLTIFYRTKIFVSPNDNTILMNNCVFLNLYLLQVEYN
jgi:hypothetical protein